MAGTELKFAEGGSMLIDSHWTAGATDAEGAMVVFTVQGQLNQTDRYVSMSCVLRSGELLDSFIAGLVAAKEAADGFEDVGTGEAL